MKSIFLPILKFEFLYHLRPPTFWLIGKEQKLIEKEKLAAIGQFASLIVHEICNPLTTIVMGLKALNQLTLEKLAHPRLSLALAESDRLSKLLREILLDAKLQKLELE